MRYHGRLLAVGIVILFNIGRYFYYHQYLDLPFRWNFFILTFFFLAIAWLGGKQYDKATYLSERDPLTGSYNRRTVEQSFQKNAHKSDKKHQSLGIIMVDLNNFKEVNDEYGHQKGDELLVRTASTIHKFVSKSDIVARWGGDEFIILVSDLQDDFANSYVKNLQREIRKSNSEYNLNVGASLGYAIYPHQGSSFQELIQLADAGMYIDKKEK